MRFKKKPWREYPRYDLIYALVPHALEDVPEYAWLEIVCRLTRYEGYDFEKYYFTSLYAAEAYEKEKAKTWEEIRKGLCGNPYYGSAYFGNGEED